MAQTRTNKGVEDAPESTNANKPEQNYPLKPEQSQSRTEPEQVTFKPECVECDELVDEQGSAACDVGGCDKPVPLPSDIPEPIRKRYLRGDVDYNALIDKLIATPLAQLYADGVWVPVWRFHRKDVA